MKYHRNVFLTLVPILILLDQWSKWLIRSKLPLEPGKRRPKVEVIEDFFNIVHAKNPGAAWGLFGDAEYRMAFFTVVTLLAFVLILGYFRQLTVHDRLLAVSLSSVFAGAAGNFIDRLMFREVTDFLQFYLPRDSTVGAFLIDKFNTSYWPAFNVADICINVGVGLFIWHVLFIEGKRPSDLAEAAAEAVPAEA
ncbi:MAG: signal peptidase II [Proteobacteria bacterium]|nr:signal peptidase II [Pseudomonadota bacterium]